MNQSFSQKDIKKLKYKNKICEKYIMRNMINVILLTILYALHI